MKQYTDITVLLDRSGSMALCKEAMESAYNEFVTGHKAVPTTRLSLVQFDSINPFEQVYTDVLIGNAGPLNLAPRGGTPLIDALVNTIDTTGRRLKAMIPSARPNQVLMVVITDGQENASMKFKREQLHEMVTKQTNQYNWQFIYLGADVNAIADAVSYGFNANMSAMFCAEDAQIGSTAKALTRSTVAYSAVGLLPEFTAEERVSMTTATPSKS